MPAKCKVTFHTGERSGGPYALLIRKRDGAVLNAMNYPRGHRFTKAERKRASTMLMAGCAEFSKKRP